ncbi:TIGR02444 family protein [Pseudomonas sp. ok272]|uniref:TIGR02444 family protein n=1 Tax=unclassified Pseudomonas TaxID=196821 RepID=UPI0008CE6A09|nr:MULTISPECIES: TIGR02444 family protein [unclassified Pseudomonas]SEM58723.1 TIGR02444 family protein [Pseudomonas sp. ok272]SFM51771.1 TIGR02444 family protein [Pseudomonas sp. ok602]
MSSDLWSFSLTTYARPGVEHACLALQAAGANVCLLLCAGWLGQRGVECTAHRLQQLREVAGPWSTDVVEPLRQLRRQWKMAAASDADLATLRTQVKALELEAERQLLLRLQMSTHAWPLGQAQDLAAWLEGLAASAANLDRDALHQLRAAMTGP